MGSLKEEKGVMVVQKDLKLSTAADIVADPSAPDAFVNGIMEGVDWVYDPVKNTWLEQKLDDTKKLIRNMSKSELQEKRLAIFENYLVSLALKSK
jgi:outer membrane protease